MITAVDLFCGAGGFSLAATRLGINVLAALENDASACATYRFNFSRQGQCPYIIEKDILDAGPDEIQRILPVNRPLDILMGGPPCQGFSTHRIKNSGVGDPRNALLLRYFDFVRILKPTAFLVENVVGLLWQRHKQYLDRFYQEALQAGYDVFPAYILDANDYGAPQRRKRVFILGWRNQRPQNLLWPPPPTHGICNNESSTLIPRRLASDVFEVAPVDDPNDVHMQHSPALIEVFRSTPHNGGSRHQSCRTLPCHENHTGHKDVYGRIDPAKPGPTMTTACVNPSKGRFLHPTENHGITVRQAARFQTFPDDFIFTGGIMSAAKQVGNAVPIKLGEAVLRSIIAMFPQSQKNDVEKTC